MSWQGYVDNLTAGGFVKGAILGHNGAVWAKSASLNFQGNEAQTLASTAFSQSALGGIKIEGQKYICLKTDDRSCYLKLGTGGAVAVKSGQAVVLGIYDQNLQPGAAANAAEKLADYLIGVGY